VVRLYAEDERGIFITFFDALDLKEIQYSLDISNEEYKTLLTNFGESRSF
jgi:hypothetical protein